MSKQWMAFWAGNAATSAISSLLMFGVGWLGIALFGVNGLCLVYWVYCLTHDGQT